jgi:mRNA-degrading endonuclease toxin of MazEF toxin-antitoxin module
VVEAHRYLAGAVYYVDDDEVELPGESTRRLHDERRPVVVVSDQGEVNQTNAQSPRDWPSVLVVPVSSSTSYRTRFDVKLSAGCGNLSKKAWARIPALQPIDKSALKELIGLVPMEVLEDITAQILNYLGLIEPEPSEEEEEGEEEEEDLAH